MLRLFIGFDTKVIKEVKCKDGSRGKNMDSSYTDKFRSPLMTFGLILLVVGLVIAFAANLSMDPTVNDQNVLVSALGRVATGISFQLLGIGLIIIGRKK